MTHAAEGGGGADTTTNNRSIDRNGTNMYDLWVINWQCSTACESEFGYPWWNICNSDDTEDQPSVASLVTAYWVGTKNWHGE
jgi:hypothetical protein